MPSIGFWGYSSKILYPFLAPYESLKPYYTQRMFYTIEPQGGGTMLSFAVSLVKNWGQLGPPETKSELIFGPNYMIFWHLE